ncbi:hypothetical protein GCM10020000_37830 [Streptomyces olivoverticillatus]
MEYGGSGYKLAVIKTSATTAYVAESRKAANNDSNACATGVLIYKIDTSVTTGTGPIRVVSNPNAAAPHRELHHAGHADLETRPDVPGRHRPHPDPREQLRRAQRHRLDVQVVTT